MVRFCFLTIIFLFLLSCVSYSITKTGVVFSDEKSWERYKDKFVAWASKGIGKITEEDAEKMLGRPLKIKSTKDLTAKGWSFSTNEVSKFDSGFYRRVNGSYKEHIVVMTFTKDKKLFDFEVQSSFVPTSTDYFSSEPVVRYYLYVYFMDRLGDVLSDSLDRSLEKFRRKVKLDVKEVSDNFEEKYVVKDKKEEGNNTSESIDKEKLKNDVNEFIDEVFDESG